MHMKRTITCLTTGGVLASAACGGAAYAQTVDALLDKLVEKGILQVEEANQLREESDKGFNAAYQVKSGMSDWVTALKLNGDFRGRIESLYTDVNDIMDRTRFRYRLRFGATAVLKDQLEVGLRLSSSEGASGGGSGGDPISGNTTLQDNGSKKLVYIDLAYAKWLAVNRPDWNAGLVVGKMENPFVFSDMVFDGDYTPEGAALQFGYTFNDQHSLKLAGGGFVLDEVSASSNDPFLFGAQARFDSTWNKRVQTSVGVAALAISGDQSLNASRSSTFNVTATATNVTSSTTWTVPNQNAGNLRTAVTGRSGNVGLLTANYNPIVADAALTFTLDKGPMYSVAFPIKVAVDFIHNPGADDENTGYSAGVTFGKAGKRGLWELSYRYKHLEGDAWYEELVDSDFGAMYAGASLRSTGATGYAAGTNVKGHILKAGYSPWDSLTLNATAFFTELIEESPIGADSDVIRVQLDALWKF